MSPQAAGKAVGSIGQQDPTSFRTALINALNKLVPPFDVDKEAKPVDKQKEAESVALAGTLVLGINLLKDLGSGESQITAQKEDYTWLLKKNEIIENILEDQMFNAEVIYAMLQGGVDKVDPIYFIKW